MFDGLKALLARVGQSLESAPDGLSQDEERIAAAALLVHVAAADGRILTEERQRMRLLLATHFQLADDVVEALLLIADARDREAGDISEFTELLRRRLDPAARTQLVTMLMDVAKADGKLHEFEDNLVWRIAGLIGAPQAG
jgi:uncharacterized tellurite resistance protein B-like protein